ncbi:MAG: hypothetical protein U1F37_22195 [Alphaproteobacteria bacterium]
MRGRSRRAGIRRARTDSASARCRTAHRDRAAVRAGRGLRCCSRGGHGKIQLDDGGQPRGLRGNFLIRARHHLTARGIGVVLVDAPSDYQGEGGLWPYRMHHDYAGDMGQAVNLVKRRFGRPVWLVGTSAGTLSVANAAARLSHANRPDGIVFTSSITRPPRRRPISVFDVHLAAYTGPALVISHEQMAAPRRRLPTRRACSPRSRPRSRRKCCC